MEDEERIKVCLIKIKKIWTNPSLPPIQRQLKKCRHILLIGRETQTVFGALSFVTNESTVFIKYLCVRGHKQVGIFWIKKKWFK